MIFMTLRVRVLSRKRQTSPVLQKGIAERLGKEYTERFNKELNEAVMNIALNVSREVSIERMGDDLRITLKDARQ